MVRGGSSLHCSRWNPNAIHKGASHYPACIYHTHTPQRARARTRKIPRDSARPKIECEHSDAWRGGAFYSVQSYTYMAVDCAATAIRALISHEIVKSRGKFIRKLQSWNSTSLVLIDGILETGDLRYFAKI